MSAVHAMQSGYTRAWLVLLVLCVALELVALARGGPGDTLSEHVWKLLHTWAGAPIFAVLAWTLLWHFPFGAGKRLGWPDALATAAGIALWLLSRPGR